MVVILTPIILSMVVGISGIDGLFQCQTFYTREVVFSQDSWRNPLEKCWGPGRIRSDPAEPIWVGVGNFSTSKVSWLMIVTAVRLQTTVTLTSGLKSSHK